MSIFFPSLGDTLLDGRPDDVVAPLGLLVVVATFEAVAVAMGQLRAFASLLKNMFASVCELPIPDCFTNLR
jgi:hypothetical protein